MNSEAFHDHELSDEERVRLRLLASRSLLSERRRGLRRSFLVDSLVAILARHGGRREAYVRDALSDLWGTTTITDVVFQQAVDEALSAGLICRQQTLEGQEKLVASTQAAEDVAVDRTWVEDAFSSFVDEIGLRTIGMPSEDYLKPKSTELADRVIEAVAHACEGSYGASETREPAYVRPTKVDLAALRRFSDSLSDERIREPTRLLAEAALDEHDDFGYAIVHLVIVGVIVHGLVAQRTESGNRPSLAGTKLLLDVSILKDFVASKSYPARRVLEEMLDASHRLDVEVYFGEHTIREWDGLWYGADQEFASNTDSQDLRLPPVVHRWLKNPFVEHYVEYRESGGNEPWGRWSESRRSLSALARKHGLKEATSEDRDLEDAFHKSLDLLNEKRTSKRRRPAAIDADAVSCALITGWRRCGGRAYFVSEDSLSPVAYREVTKDATALTVDVRSWALYVTNLITDDPDAAIAVAELVGRAVARDALFSVASTYPLDFVRDFVEIIREQDSEVSAEEVRGLDEAQTEIFDSLRALTEEADRDPATTGAMLAHKLASRRLARAEIERRRQVERDRRHASELEAMRAEIAVREAEKAQIGEALRSEREAREVERADREAERLADERRDAIRSRRRKVLTAASVASLLWLALAGTALVEWTGVAVGVVVLSLYLIQGLQWADDLEKPERALWLQLLGLVAIELLAVLVSRVFS